MGAEKLLEAFLFKSHLVKLALLDCRTGDAACESTGNLYFISFISGGLNRGNPIKIRRAPAGEGHVEETCLSLSPAMGGMRTRPRSPPPHLSPKGSWDMLRSGCPVKCSVFCHPGVSHLLLYDFCKLLIMNVVASSAILSGPDVLISAKNWRSTKGNEGVWDLRGLLTSPPSGPEGLSRPDQSDSFNVPLNSFL